MVTSYSQRQTYCVIQLILQTLKFTCLSEDNRESNKVIDIDHRIHKLKWVWDGRNRRKTDNRWGIRVLERRPRIGKHASVSWNALRQGGAMILARWRARTGCENRRYIAVRTRQQQRQSKRNRVTELALPALRLMLAVRSGVGSC